MKENKKEKKIMIPLIFFASIELYCWFFYRSWLLLLVVFLSFIIYCLLKLFITWLSNKLGKKLDEGDVVIMYTILFIAYKVFNYFIFKDTNVWINLSSDLLINVMLPLSWKIFDSETATHKVNSICKNCKNFKEVTNEKVK